MLTITTIIINKPIYIYIYIHIRRLTPAARQTTSDLLDDLHLSLLSLLS